MSNARNLADIVTGNFDVPLGALDNITTDVVADTTPQLGGDLDLNSNDITGVTNNGNIRLNTSATTPSSPVDGQVWWDNLTGNVKIYDSTQSNWFLVKSGLDGSSSARALPDINLVTSYLGNNFAAGTYYINTPDGGVQQAYLMHAENYVWVLVGRFQADASQTIQNVIPSKRALIDVSQNGASYWSADWGSAAVQDVMIWGATDFMAQSGHTVNWVYELKGNSTLRGFFAGLNSGDDYNNSEDNLALYTNNKRGLRCYGARDGVFKGSRWTNSGFNYIMISDDAGGHWTNSHGFTNPISSTTYWNGGGDAKLIVSDTNQSAGQDYGAISQGFGFDDTYRHFADFYPSQGPDNANTINYSSAVTIWARF
jgi:hypothetical protein